MAMPKVVYIVGRIHGPGKPSFEDLVVVSDEFTQQELDDLDVNGLPLAIDHPPPNTPIANHPELVCGKVTLGVRGADGSKRVFAVVHTDTPAGAAAFERLQKKESGLSLGHTTLENRYAETNELHSREHIGDHVALCAQPRRPGCTISFGAYEQPATNLTTAPDISPPPTRAASDSFLPPTVSGALVSSSRLVMASQPAQQAAPAAQASAPMDTSAPGAAAPKQYTPEKIAEMERDLAAASAEVAASRNRNDEFLRGQQQLKANEEEMNKWRAELAQTIADRDRLLKEQNEERLRQANNHKKEIAADLRKIMTELKGIREKYPTATLPEIDEAALLQLYAPDGATGAQESTLKDQFRQFATMSFASIGLVHDYAAMATENERMRQEWAAGGAGRDGVGGPNKRALGSDMPMRWAPPSVPASVQQPPSAPAASAPPPRPSASYSYDMRGFSLEKMGNTSQNFERLVEEKRRQAQAPRDMSTPYPAGF